MAEKRAAWPQAVCTRLELIQQTRDALKSEEADLRGERGSLYEELVQLGAGETEEHLDKSRKYVVALMKLEYVRKRIKTLADLADKTVREASQGALFEDDNSDVVNAKKLTLKAVFKELQRDDPAQRRLHAEDDDGAPQVSLFPAIYRLVPTKLHPTGAKREVVVECKTREELQTAVEDSLETKDYQLSDQSGLVSIGDATVLTVEFVRELKGGKKGGKAA